MFVFEFELAGGHTDILNSLILCPVKLLPYLTNTSFM
jgi:hypothetical protein